MVIKRYFDPDLDSLIREMERFRDKPQSFAPDEVEVMMRRALNAVSQLALLHMKVGELEDAGPEWRA